MVRVVTRVKYAYVACLKVAMWFVFALYGLMVFMVYWKEGYSESCQTSNTELLKKEVNELKVLTFGLRRLIGFQYTSTEYKVTCWARFGYVFQNTFCLKNHVYFAITVELDFHSTC